jgi:MerR family transcriptional regulator, copper efflux regulator
MRIGELASKAAVNIQTVRFYERKGILKNPPRAASGYRCYGERDLETLCFVRRSQELGFTLHEVAQLLPLHHSVATTPSRSRNRRPREMRQMADVARRRLEQVDQKLLLLKTMRTQLLEVVTQLETVAPTKCLAPARPAAKKQHQLCPA